MAPEPFYHREIVRHAWLLNVNTQLSLLVKTTENSRGVFGFFETRQRPRDVRIFVYVSVSFILFFSLLFSDLRLARPASGFDRIDNSRASRVLAAEQHGPVF